MDVVDKATPRCASAVAARHIYNFFIEFYPCCFDLKLFFILILDVDDVHKATPHCARSTAAAHFWNFFQICCNFFNFMILPCHHISDIKSYVKDCNLGGISFSQYQRQVLLFCSI